MTSLLANITVAPFRLSWQSIKLLILFEQLFVGSEFRNFLLFYDSGTVDFANVLLGRFSTPRPGGIFQHDLVTYNVDRRRRTDAADAERLAACFSHSVSVELFANHNAVNVYRFRAAVYALHVSPHWIRIHQPHGDDDRPMCTFVNYWRYMACIELKSDGGQRIWTYNYQQRQQMQLFDARGAAGRSMYAQLFADQRIDMLGRRLYMYGDMDAPNLFRAVAFDGHNGPGREVRGVSGFYASICWMIGKYFNTSVLFVQPVAGGGFPEEIGNEGGAAAAPMAWTDGRTNDRRQRIGRIGRSDPSRAGGFGRGSDGSDNGGRGADEVEADQPYKEYARLRERYYRTDSVLPGVQKARVSYDLYDEFLAVGHAMYPHRQENYVVLVPNQHHRPPQLWLVLAASPLTIVWMSAIGLYATARCAVRSMQWRPEVGRRLGGRKKRCSRRLTLYDVNDILLETWGLAFGWAIAVRPSGRADRVMLLSVSLFAIVSGVFCSGLLMQQFAFNKHRPAIQTVADLNADTNVTIVLPLGLGVNRSMWNPNQ